MAKTSERGHIGAIMAVGVGLALIGGLAIVIVVVMGLAGAVPSRALTWIGMITLPVAFILMALEFVRMVLRRRA